MRNIIDRYKEDKTFLIVGGIVGIGAVVLIYKKFIASKGDKEEKSREKDLKKLYVSKSNLTIDEDKANLIAQNLLAAMNRWGTDEKAIFDNLMPLNRDDLLLVMKSFGIKPYNGETLATRGYEISFFSSQLNLIGWLRAELSGDDLKKVKRIFTENGIPF